MKILKRSLLVLLCLLLAAVAAAGTYYFSVTRGVRLDASKFEPAAASMSIYDKNDAPVATVARGSAKKSVLLADLPEYVPQAFIAAEDKHFYSHHGLDYKGMARAALKNMKAGAFKQGASTISQQLVKNTQLSPERTIRRKLQEIKLTRQLERRYTKDEILELYLNTIYFGHACYGIADAADFYFGKKAQDLTAAEGAMLAALIRSPNTYSPFANAEKCLAARNSVLTRMYGLGYLDESACEAAKNESLPTREDNAIGAQSYLDAVRREFETLPIFAPYSLRGGCKVYTYMDAPLQEYAETLKTTADRSGKSIVICDNGQFAVSALYSTEGRIARPPGSAIKPLAVYAPAIEEGLLSPCTPLLDEKTNFDGYAPSNYNDKYYGYVSAGEALAKSLNIPAVKVMQQLGPEKSVRYLTRLGLHPHENDKNLSLALGGMTRGCTLTELAGAYTSFARGGLFTPPAFIRKVEDGAGNVLYKRDTAPLRVFGKDTAELVNEMLEGSVTNGTAKKLAALPFPVCAKTGTCGNDAGNTDAYCVGYTAEHTVAVWMGNADNSLTDISGGGLPSHYAMLLLKEIYKEKRPAPLPEGDAAVCRIDRAAYERDHVVALASEYEPDAFVMTAHFKKDQTPRNVTSIFGQPTANASITWKNNSVCIELCGAEYYAYLIERENNGKKQKVLDGFTPGLFTDKNLAFNEKYTYTVTPYYIGNNGERIYGKKETLPAVYIKTDQNKKDEYGEWWKN